MSDDFDQAAGRIVSNLGHGRARQYLDILEVGDVLSVLGLRGKPSDEIDADDERALVQACWVVNDADDALAWDEAVYADKDRLARMRRGLVAALRRELDAT